MLAKLLCHFHLFPLSPNFILCVSDKILCSETTAKLLQLNSDKNSNGTSRDMNLLWHVLLLQMCFRCAKHCECNCCNAMNIRCNMRKLTARSNFLKFHFGTAFYRCKSADEKIYYELICLYTMFMFMFMFRLLPPPAKGCPPSLFKNK